MVERDALVGHLDALLNVSRFRDYAPNGLQVEGRPEIRKIVSGVTACQSLLDAAVERNADAVLVHHGYFWKSEAAEITGMKKRRLATLLGHDISLLAYHLPLDGHAEYGNNRQLGEVLGIRGAPVTDQVDELLWQGRLSSPLDMDEFAALIATRLGRKPQSLRGGDARIERVAWCTGAAQSGLERAASLGMDAFVSGEISEQTMHIVRECGIHYFAAGHHATERYGVRALGEYLSAQFGIHHENVDIANPV